MPGVARNTDLFAGMCCCHSKPTCISMGGVIVTASGDVKANNLGVARSTDVVLGFCGDIGLIVSSSSNVKANSLGVARLGDAVAGCLMGIVATASGDVNAN